MKQNQVHRKEAPSKEEIPFELSSLNQKLEVSTHSRLSWRSGRGFQAHGTQYGLSGQLPLQALSEFRNNYYL